MKKIKLFLFAFLLSVSAFSQAEVARNEVSLNLLRTAFMQYPEISYERILNRDMSIGVAFGIDNYYHFNFTPFARWFFGNNCGTERWARGFFAEINSSVHRFSYLIDHGYHGYLRHMSSAIGIGTGIGWKYLTRSGNWTGEVMFGSGRNVLKADRYCNQDFYLRVGISIGRRF